MAKRITATDNVLPDVKDVGQIDPDVYNGIAKCAELLSVQMIDSTFSILPEFFGEGDGKNSIDFSHVHASFDDESRISTSIFLFEEYKKKGRTKVFCLKSKFAVFYRIPTDCDETHAVAFSTKTGVMACYPYFRAHAAQTASLANAEMPILPTIASLPLKKNGAEK